MIVLVGLGFSVLGIVLVLCSRSFADNCFVPAQAGKRQSAFVVYMGLGDSYLARLYRWFAMSAVGVFFVGVGIGVFAGAIPVD